MSWRPENWEDLKLKAIIDITNRRGKAGEVWWIEAGADAMLEARAKAWRDVILSVDSGSDNSMWGNELFRSRILLLTLIPDETKGG